MNKYNDGWYDAVDHMPYLVCKCLLSNGDVVDGRRVMGDWENMDGEIIYPTHFKIDRGIVITPMYTFTHGKDEGDIGAVLRDGLG